MQLSHRTGLVIPRTSLILVRFRHLSSSHLFIPILSSKLHVFLVNMQGCISIRVRQLKNKMMYRNRRVVPVTSSCIHKQFSIPRKTSPILIVNCLTYKQLDILSGLILEPANPISPALFTITVIIKLLPFLVCLVWSDFLRYSLCVCCAKIFFCLLICRFAIQLIVFPPLSAPDEWIFNNEHSLYFERLRVHLDLYSFFRDFLVHLGPLNVLIYGVKSVEYFITFR